MTRAFTADRALVASLRLSAQAIAEPRFHSAVEVVHHLLAMQAQDFGGALYAVALRTPQLTEADVLQAIADRQIVRSWPMRGTLHFTAAEDLGWMLALTGPRMISGVAGRQRQLGLDDEQLAHAARIAEQQLAATGVVGRTALLAAFDAAGLSTAGQRGAHLLWHLSVSGRLVWGPVDGKQHSFVALDDWVRSPRRLEGDEALAEFARRYVRSHGPASDRDLAWWSSLTLTQARRGLAIVADEFERLDLDGTAYLHDPALERAAPAVHALPGFDEYVLGYQNRTAQLSAEWFERIVPGGNGMFLPTIVVDGEIVGTWKRTATAKRIVVDTVPFAPISARNRAAFARAVQRYGRFAGKPVEIRE